MNAPAAATDRFALEVPAEPVHVGTARIFAAALARAHGIDEDVVEEVKVGISEACSMGMRWGRASGRPLRISVAGEEGRLRFEVWGDVPEGWPLHDVGAESTPTPTGIAATLSREVLTTLFPDAALEAQPDGRGVVRFSVALPGA